MSRDILIPMLVIIVMICVLMVGIIAFVDHDDKCSSMGGVLVRGIYGFVCVKELR